MTSYVALLRGVNLLGVRTIKMADLRAIAEQLGLQSSQTFIASGNLLFVSSNLEEELRLMLEPRLRAHIGRDVRAMIRTADEMDAIARANPFAEAPGNNVQAFFLNEPPPVDWRENVRNQDDERIAAGKREIYVAYGTKGIGRSRMRIPAAEAGTARNMNTVAKLAALAKEMA